MGEEAEDQVDGQLGAEIHHNQEAKQGIRNVVQLPKGHEQQGR